MERKYNFNIYDIIIIITVVLCILGIIYRGTLSDGISKTVYNDTAEISFVIKETDGNFISAIKPGDKFYFKNGAEFGTLLEGYSYKNTETYVANEEGTFQKTENTEKFDLAGRFISNGRFTSNGFLCGVEKVFINSEIELHSSDAVCIIKVTEVKNTLDGSNVQ